MSHAVRLPQTFSSPLHRDDLLHPPAMANIHFIDGEKGGVGKSLVARVVTQHIIDCQLPFLGFDTDRSHGALMRFYMAFASPVLIDRQESLDAIVEAAIENPARRVLVGLAAQTHDPLVKSPRSVEKANSCQ